MDRDEIIAELKRVAALLGKESLTIPQFRLHAHFGVKAVKRRFGAWNKAIEAAGLVPFEGSKRKADSDLEDEFRRVYEALGKIPTSNEFAMESRFSPTTYERRFGGWRQVLSHYLGAEGQQAPAMDGKTADKTQGIVETPSAPTWAPAGGKPRRVFGPPLNFRELRHEPINEQGVVLLFGMVARELEFLVEGVGTGYPDCRAKRRARGGYYVEVNIEFEFKSSNFQEHGHDAARCDLIVCWIHDWPQCPIEVLELRSEIGNLKPNV